MKYVLLLVVFACLQIGICRAANSALYFSDGHGIGWCNLAKVGSISACTPQNSHYQSFGLSNIALVSDESSGIAYAVLAQNSQQISVWQLDLDSTGNLTTIQIGTTNFPIGFANSFSAQFVSNFNSSGSDAILLQAGTGYFNSTSSYIVIDTYSWEVVFSFKALANNAIFNNQGVGMVGDYIYYASVLTASNNPNTTLDAVSVSSSVPSPPEQVFVCDGSQIPACLVKDFVVMNGNLYFSTGWQIWVVSPGSPTTYKLWYQFDQIHVSGVFAAAFTDGTGTYWYFDAMKNTNYVQNGQAYAGKNQLGNLCSYVSSAVVV